MHKKIVYGTQGGFPFDQDIIEHHQQAYSDVFEQIAKWIGNKIVISGSLQNGGWCIIDGEILPFDAQNGLVCHIEETTTSLLFENGNNEPVWKTRTIKNGIGATTYNWADFKTLDSTAINMLERIVTLENMTIPAGLPKGSIIMWHGDSVGGLGAIPTGWALCDGQTVLGYTTPDLRDRFVVGYNPASNTTPTHATGTQKNYARIGNTGGVDSVTLTIAQMPAHNHTAWDYDRILKHTGNSTFQSVDNIDTSTSEPDLASSVTMPIAGGSQPHENRPSYIVLAFIVKIVN